MTKQEASVSVDVSELFVQAGAAVLRARLESLSVQELKAIIAREQFDTGRMTRRWKDAKRLADFILASTSSRVTHGDAFLDAWREVEEGKKECLDAKEAEPMTKHARIVEAVKAAKTEAAIEAALMECTKAELYLVLLAVRGADAKKAPNSWRKAEIAHYYAMAIKTHNDEEAFRALSFEAKYEYITGITRSRRERQKVISLLLLPLAKFCRFPYTNHAVFSYFQFLQLVQATLRYCNIYMNSNRIQDVLGQIPPSRAVPKALLH